MHQQPPLQYLCFDLSEDTDGVGTLEAVASTLAAQGTAVQAEVAQVLDWARAAFPHTHGPVNEGFDWDHDVQVLREGDWHTVTLALSGSAAFCAAFAARFMAESD